MRFVTAGMSYKYYAYVIWQDTQQKSFVPCSSVLHGAVSVGEEVVVKWRGKSYDTTIMEIGM